MENIIGVITYHSFSIQFYGAEKNNSDGYFHCLVQPHIRFYNFNRVCNENNKFAKEMKGAISE